MDEQCREILEGLEVYLDGECPQDLEAAIAYHLGDCPPCLGRADFERELRVLVARRCREAAPSGLLDRVVERLKARVAGPGGEEATGLGGLA